MARVVPTSARTIVERNVIYRAGQPVRIENEETYHHLIRTGRFRDADYSLREIVPAKVLPRLKPGTVVTIVREQGLGDVLMVLVVVRALKEAYPHLGFRLATGRWYLPLVEGIHFLEGAEALMDLRGLRTYVIDLRGVPERDGARETTERIDIFARHCAVRVTDYSLPISPVTREEASRARALIGDGPCIALAVRGSTHVRTWPLESVRAFAELAAHAGWTVAVLDGAPFEMPSHHRIVNLTGQASLLETKAVIAASEFCVSPDSGLQHLAEAVGTKCLALYSTTPPALRIAHYRHVKALWRAGLPCVPCFDRGCPAAPCMQIAPELVMRGIENWDRLGLATNIDADLLPLPTSLRIDCELEIMEAWLAGTCYFPSVRLPVAAEEKIMGAWPNCATG